MSPAAQSVVHSVVLGLQGWVLGALASVVFFSLLWLTLERAVFTPRPAILLATSFVLRLALLLGVFAALATHGPGAGFERLLGALLGFLSIRQWAIARWRPAPSPEVEESTVAQDRLL